MRRYLCGPQMVVAVGTIVVTLALTVAPASASKASIVAAINRYAPAVTVAEGKLTTALGSYEQGGPITAVVAADGKVVATIHTLRAKVAAQPAGASKKAAKAKAEVERGLKLIERAYRHLKKAFATKSVSPTTAAAQAKKAIATAAKGRKSLIAGINLLG